MPTRKTTEGLVYHVKTRTAGRPETSCPHGSRPRGLIVFCHGNGLSGRAVWGEAIDALVALDTPWTEAFRPIPRAQQEGKAAAAAVARQPVDGMDCLTLDLLGHGASHSVPRPEPFAIDSFGHNILACIAHHKAQHPDLPFAPAIGVGHSIGSTSLQFAELLQPHTFRALLLFEPIILPNLGLFETPMAASSRKRRRRFASRAEVRAHLAKKSTYATWSPTALDTFAQDCVLDVPGLACHLPTHVSWPYLVG